MRFNFDCHEMKSDQRCSVTPKEEVEWVQLQKHPVFTSVKTTSGGSSAVRNLMAWDGASRLYFWDNQNSCLHRISIQLGEPNPTSVIAASPSKVLKPDMEVDFVVKEISINRKGSTLLFLGCENLCVMNLYGCTSTEDEVLICRTVMVGSQVYARGSNPIQLLRVLWHPYGDTHLGVLSSDSVFRLFNLSSDIMLPEQEYYLQPVDPGRCRNASSICPVDFSFGGDHLWDRFSVFILFSDGSIYILCPVVPFGGLFKSEAIAEIYNDAHTFGIQSTNSTAVSNSNMAISWLDATFPELLHQATDEGDLSVLRAHAYAVFDASLSLQGPLQRVGHGGNENSMVSGSECEGRAVSFLYNLVSKDSILVTAWSSGQLQIDALADEIQPVWINNSPPRLHVDSHDSILGLAMICESDMSDLPVMKLDRPLDHIAWSGYPPPLLRLAIVDLALPKKESGSSILLFVDSLMPERIYSLHDGGVDSIVLHFLPFTSQAHGKGDLMKTPSVHPVLSTCQSDNFPSSQLSGFASLSDSFGYSWMVAVTSSQECVVLEMKTWNLILPVSFYMEKPNHSEEELEEREALNIIISKELLSGPQVVIVPQASPSLRSVPADSIEGRSTLHQYSKLFHENYVEYAHKVHFELKHHTPRLKKIVDDLNARLSDAQKKLVKVEDKQLGLVERINDAVQMQNSLEERLQHLRSLPGVHKKPLSRAEQDFKSELDHFRDVELDALHSSIDSVSARLRRHIPANRGNNQKKILGKKNYEETQISLLKSSLEKLSIVNHDNTQKVKLVESALKYRESGRASKLATP